MPQDQGRGDRGRGAPSQRLDTKSSTKHEAGVPDRALRTGWAAERWPIGIAIGLGIVVLVDFAFAWVAVSGADAISPSYEAERR